MGVGNQEQTAFAFEGNWKEFAPIAFTNLLLTIVTLGIYRFWATTRERQYLWSKTRFIDDHLEWVGTGKELFLGALAALAVIFLPLFGFQFLIQSLVLQGSPGWAALLSLAFYFFLFWIIGAAIFRGLRYRLSRTQWHGIRGGSEDNGFGYGVTYMWKTWAGALAAGLLVPWSMTSLWADRWNRMSFGPHRFESSPDFSGLMGRYLLCYLVPMIVFIVVIVSIFGSMATNPSPDGILGSLAGLLVVLYIVLPLVITAFYAAYFREVVGTLSLSKLEFAFAARTKDWILLFLGNVGLVIATLGIGAIFISYRNWSFFIRHLEAGGEVSLSELTQSETPDLKQGEGLLDAFDMGAI